MVSGFGRVPAMVSLVTAVCSAVPIRLPAALTCVAPGQSALLFPGVLVIGLAGCWPVATPAGLDRAHRARAGWNRDRSAAGTRRSADTDRGQLRSGRLR